MKIFISGTQDDLQPERKAVAEVIRALGHEPLMAETYGAQPMPSLSAIREMIDQADIYIGVYGARYGWKMDSGVSVTEFEFSEFRRKDSRRILTYIKETLLELDQNVFLTCVQDFKEGYFRRPKFKDTQQLAAWVKEDLPRLIDRTRYDIPGVSEPALGKVYLEQLAAQKIPTLWDDTLYLDRAVAPSADLFARTVARYDPRIPEQNAKTNSEPIQTALVRERKLVLLGEPGLGKTTSLHASARDVAQQAQGEIPIYAELKYYDGSELETLLAQSVNKILAASKRMLAPDLAESTRVLKQWLAQSDARFLLLLDGLNEVRPEHHTAIRNALDTLLRFPHCVIVSCREHDYDESLSEHPTAFVLQPLQEDEIREYLQRALGDNGKKLFDDQIHEYEKMETLAGNPLMLWLIALVAQSDPEARLPENRGKLFQQFVAQMPRLRRREGIPDRVPLDVVETALAKLGFEMQERGQLTPDLGQTRGWQIPAERKWLEGALMQAKDWRLLKSDGQLGKPVEFLHRLFQEYFAAQHLRQQLGKQRNYDRVLGKRLFKNEWYEAIVMLAGILDQPMELVTWLAEQAIKKKHARAALVSFSSWYASDAVDDIKIRSLVREALTIGLRDRDLYSRIRTAFALVKVGDERAMKALISALRNSKDVGRVAVALAVVSFGQPAIQPLITMMPYLDKDTRNVVAFAFQMFGEAAVEPLIRALEIVNDNLRDVISLALWNIGVPAVEPLIATLYGRNRIARIGAADALGMIGDPRAVIPLSAALRDPDKDLRQHIAIALGRIGGPRAMKRLITSLHDSDVRGNAAMSLSLIGVPAIEVLIVALHDPDHDIRWAVAFALMGIGTPAVEPLISILDDPDDNVRELVTYTLGQIGDRQSVLPLVSKLRDPNPHVRWRAAEGLGNIGDPRALAELEQTVQEEMESAWHTNASERWHAGWHISVAERAREAAKEIRKKSTDNATKNVAGG